MRVLRGLTAIIVVAACRTAPRAAEPSAVRPEASHEGGTAAAAPAGSTGGARPGYTAADVRFMQGMIAHHAQALVMTSLVPSRTSREDMRLLAQRITVSQRDEIALMQHWLERRHQQVPSADTIFDPHRAHHMAGGMAGGHDMTMMPGMLTDAEMAQLAAATGSEFDRLFLQYMIRHHEGALTMVADLFATTGAAQDPDTFRFASDVEADQRAEIARMRAMLDATTTPTRPPGR